LPRVSAAPTRATAALTCALTLLALVGCGGGGGSGGAEAPPVVSAGAGCDVTYTLTDSPLLTGTDPLLERQWHLRNTGQGGGTAGEDLRAIDAWATTRGAGVRVAVIDDAIEILHVDLKPNVVDRASRSYRPGNRGSQYPVPCVARVDDHGTAVAGLVLARDDNGVGVAGVAPRASLVAYDALSSGTDADIADALTRESGLNQIYQNSWGSPDDGRLHPAENSFVAAIRNGIETGRDGKGSVFVFPGGNGGCYARDSGSGACQVDNANFDGYVNRLGVIAACAVDRSGRKPWYAEPGANLLVCGPSSGDAPDVTTTGLKGTYRDDFSGTSASTPMVTGVVALMLAANPALTWRDVRLILAESARRNDPTDAGWTSGPGGLPFNHKYGFGVADAQAAVARARNWTSVGGYAAMRTCVIAERAPGAALPDPAADGTPVPVADSVVVSGCAITAIEFVELRLTASHPYSGDLRVRLTGPAGTTSELADARTCLVGSQPSVCGDYTNWSFGSVRHLGEAANGTWTLQVTDMVPIDTGRLDRWSIVIHGR
jgi:subtilisin family serine protease